MNDSIAVFNLLIKMELFDWSLTDSEDLTLLHTAISCNSSSPIVEHMVRHGADVFAKGIGGRTPIAYVGDDLKQVERVDGIAKKIVSSEWGETEHPSVIVCAGEGGRFDLVRHFLHRGVSVDTQMEDGCTALMATVSGGHLNIVKDILKVSPKLHIQDERGQNVLHYCVRSGKMDECMRLILRNLKGASIYDTADKDGKTPLHIASEAYKKTCIELLLECGAKFNVKDNNDKTPLDYAADKASLDCARGNVRPFDKRRTPWRDTPALLQVRLRASHT